MRPLSRLLAAVLMFVISKECFSEPVKKNTVPIWSTKSVISPNRYSDTLPSAPKKMPWYIERFHLRAGLFVPITNTDVQVSLADGKEGTHINFENDLGLSRAISTYLVNFEWRVSRRSRINAIYYNIARGSFTVLKKDITFDSTTYQTNTQVNSFFNTAIYQLSYGYAILSKPTYEAGILIGTHTVGFSTGISLVGTSAGIDKSSDFKFTAPLPDLGLWGSYVLSNRFALSLYASYLAMTIDNTNGRVLSYNFQLLYKLIKRLDVSLGFTGLDFKVEKTVKNSEGSFAWGYNGPSLSLSFSFGKKGWEHSTNFDGR